MGEASRRKRERRERRERGAVTPEDAARAQAETPDRMGPAMRAWRRATGTTGGVTMFSVEDGDHVIFVTLEVKNRMDTDAAADMPYEEIPGGPIIGIAAQLGVPELVGAVTHRALAIEPDATVEGMTAIPAITVEGESLVDGTPIGLTYAGTPAHLREWGLRLMSAIEGAIKGASRTG